MDDTRHATQMNNLLSPTPLPLPFALSPGSSPYRKLLGLEPHENEHRVGSSYDYLGVAQGSLPAEEYLMPSSYNVTPRHVRGTSAAASQGAFNRVDQIMLKSWSERDVSGMEAAAHPTMFGAVVRDERCST